MNKKTIFAYFLIGFFIALICSGFTPDTNAILVNQKTEIYRNAIPTHKDLADLIQLTFSTIAGIISVIVVAFLKQRYPALFGVYSRSNRRKY